MSNDNFLEVLSSKCTDLQRSLAAEYRGTVFRLEEQIKQVNAENTQLYKQLQGSRGGSAAGHGGHEGDHAEKQKHNLKLKRSASKTAGASDLEGDALESLAAASVQLARSSSRAGSTQPTRSSGRHHSGRPKARSMKKDDLDEAANYAADTVRRTESAQSQPPPSPKGGARKEPALHSKGASSSELVIYGDPFKESPVTRRALSAEGEEITTTGSLKPRLRGRPTFSSEIQHHQVVPYASDSGGSGGSGGSGKTLEAKADGKADDKAEDDEDGESASLGSSSGSASSIMFEVADVWQNMMTKRTKKNMRKSMSSGWIPGMRTSILGGRRGSLERRGSVSSAVSAAGSGQGFGRGSMRGSARTSLVSSAIAVHGEPGRLVKAMEYCMMEPNSGLHLVWEALSAFMILYDLVIVPMEAFEPPEVPFTQFMTWAVRIFWTFDIIVNCLTGYLDAHGRTVIHPVMVTKRYAMRQLHLDLLVVGSDWAEQAIGIRATGIFKGWRILRILRLLRLKKAKELMETAAEHIRSERVVVITSVTKMLIGLVTLSHLIGCFMYLILTMDVENAVGLESEWLPLDKPLGARYMQCFHFAISLFFGEHTMMPRTFAERFFVSFCLALTFTLQIWFVSFITTAMTHLEIISTERSAKFSALNRFMSDNSVPREVALKVERNAKRALAEQERNVPESHIDLLKLISDPMMMELHYEIYMPTLKIHPFLRLFAELDPPGVRKVCHSAVSLLSVAKHDVLFLATESANQAFHGPRMLFVLDGELEYLRQDFEREPVTKDHWISEGVMWTGEWVHVGTLRAASECRLLALDVRQFQEFAKESSMMSSCSYAIGFVEMLNNVDEGAITDVGAYTHEMASLLQETFQEDFQLVRHEYDVKWGLKRKEESEDEASGRRRSDENTKGSIASSSPLGGSMGMGRSSTERSCFSDRSAAKVVPSP